MDVVLRRLDREALETLAAEGFLPEEVELQHTADMRYRGQSSELGVRIPPGLLRPEVLRALVESFQQEHEHTFGYRSDGEAIQFVGLRLRARGLPRDPVTPEALSLVAGGRSNGPSERPRSRQAYFGPDHGWVHTPVVSRADLTGSPSRGPMIVEEYDATVAVPLGATVARDEVGNIRIDVASLL
jgi:N-methylhydantoinase A